jgi:glycosyltransferase involved in cell wall biosynthesis
VSKRILILGPLPPPRGGQAMMTEIIVDTLNTKCIINTNTLNKSKILHNIYVVLKILYFNLFYRFDIIYFTATRSKFGSIKDLLLLFLFSFNKKKIITHIHGNDIDFLTDKGILSNLTRKLYQNVDYVLLVSNYQKKLFENIFSDKKLKVIKNCYPLELDNLSVDIYKNGNGNNLLYLSIIMYSKGIFNVLDSFEKLAINNPKLTLTIAGSFGGDDFLNQKNVQIHFFDKYNYLKKKYNQRIHYIGEISGETKRQVLLKSDILVFPTFFKSESFGIVIVEAMRAGCAICATQTPFIKEIVNDKSGILIESQNTIALSEAILLLTSNQTLLKKMKIYNVNEAIINYSPRSYKNKFLNFLDSI